MRGFTYLHGKRPHVRNRILRDAFYPSVRRYCLTLHGAELQNHRKMEDYQIRDGSELKVKLRGSNSIPRSNSKPRVSSSKSPDRGRSRSPRRANDKAKPWYDVRGQLQPPVLPVPAEHGDISPMTVPDPPLFPTHALCPSLLIFQSPHSFPYSRTTKRVWRRSQGLSRGGTTSVLRTVSHRLRMTN